MKYNIIYIFKLCNIFIIFYVFTKITYKYYIYIQDLFFLLKKDPAKKKILSEFFFYIKIYNETLINPKKLKNITKMSLNKYI